ncbi:MAG: hypothetical protein ACT4OW_02065 [Nitrososphaerota archaeon]
MKKSSYAIGIGIVIAIIIAMVGISYTDIATTPPDNDTESIGTNDAVTVNVEPAEETEGKELQVSVSDGVESQEGP